MRTTFPIMVVLALGIAIALFTGSGFNALIQGDTPAAQQISERVNSTANDTSAGRGELAGSRSGADDSSIVGLAISGGRNIAKITGMVALLPVTLHNLGFPQWFASPIGWSLTILISIGVMQFITGRIYE